VISRVKYYADEGEANPQLMCEELMEDCLEKNSKDNMSAVIILFKAGSDLVRTTVFIIYFDFFRP